MEMGCRGPNCELIRFRALGNVFVRYCYSHSQVVVTTWNSQWWNSSSTMTLVAFSCGADGCGFETTKAEPGIAMQQLQRHQRDAHTHVYHQVKRQPLQLVQGDRQHRQAFIKEEGAGNQGGTDNLMSQGNVRQVHPAAKWDSVSGQVPHSQQPIKCCQQVRPGECHEQVVGQTKVAIQAGTIKNEL